MDTEYFFRLFFSGLTRGSIYALLALGYTMVYGIIKLINFAHGEIYMIGAFIALIMSGVFSIMGLPVPAIAALASLVALVYSSAYGYTVEKLAYKPLRRAPRLSVLIGAIGMSLFLQNYVLLSQTSNFLPFPSMLPGLRIPAALEEIVSPVQVFIFATTTVVMVILTLLIKYTKMGKSMRATSQDRTMATLVGINVNRVISWTFLIGSFTAALGGILISSFIGQINFYIGFVAGIKAFVAAVLGGIGSIPGAVLGSLVLGMAESYAAGYLSSVYEDVFAFLILVVILIFKPSGLLGKPEVQKV
ncbi:MAG: branched-chain amino acid ABC transporter permease LivH [Spirochaeta sp.]|jgi:branched-chain amino acid transport system permease protein|nr:branched-chain amino acid ABC transporter permease LivH [Spirochaeta sp.]